MGTRKDDGKLEVDEFSKTWASFVDIADALQKLQAKFIITWLKDCVYWGWHRV